TGLEERANSTRAMTAMSFNELCYPDNHPYHYSADGYLDTARARTREDVVQSPRNYSAPAGMVVTVVGAMGAQEACDRVRFTLGDWRAERPVRAAAPRGPATVGGAA